MTQHTPTIDPSLTAVALEQARAAEAAAHDRTTRAAIEHLAVLIRSAFPGADGITVAFPHLDSDGRWDAVLATVWAGRDEFADPAETGEPAYEEVLYDHQAAQRPHRLAVGRDDWQDILSDVEHLLAELGADGALHDWAYANSGGGRRYCTLAELAGVAEG